MLNQQIKDSLLEHFNYDPTLDRLIWKKVPSTYKRAPWLLGRPAGAYTTSRGWGTYYVWLNKQRHGLKDLREVWGRDKFTKIKAGRSECEPSPTSINF